MPWSLNDLTKISVSSAGLETHPPTPAWTPCGFVNVSPNTQSILYVSGDGKVQELRYENDHWTWYALSDNYNAQLGMGVPNYAYAVLVGSETAPPGNLPVPNGFVAYHGRQRGSLYSLAWVSNEWKCQPILGTPDSQYPALGAYGMKPGMFLWHTDAVLYVVFRDQDGTLGELSTPYQAVNQAGQLPWSYEPIPIGAHQAASDPVGLLMPGDPDTKHLFYVDVERHVRHLSSQARVGGWIADPQALDQLTGGPPAEHGSLLSAWGYIPDPQTEYSVHVVYRSTDGEIYEIAQRVNLDGSNEWILSDLTAQPVDVPKAAGDPVGYVTQYEGVQHVVYTSVSGLVRELYYAADDQNNYRWQFDDFAGPANNVPYLPTAASDPAGYSWEKITQQHIVFISQRTPGVPIPAGHICELYRTQ